MDKDEYLVYRSNELIYHIMKDDCGCWETYNMWGDLVGFDNNSRIEYLLRLWKATHLKDREGNHTDL